MKFADFVGHMINLYFVRFQGQHLVKLLGVEPTGIWVENQQVTNLVLQAYQAPSATKTLVWFMPYHEIAFAAMATEGTSLNETAFGVSE